MSISYATAEPSRADRFAYRGLSRVNKAKVHGSQPRPIEATGLDLNQYGCPIAVAVATYLRQQLADVDLKHFSQVQKLNNVSRRSQRSHFSCE
ncbi:hypothetical protein DPM35_29565 [Mesorhizobium atlanticum]|uniref:Uncharacterized protein n=1 Tax=Mesorhizobium atlanticum TaxID=2233532 RepID=A0A330GGI7_9HYPH|nr:hypothetical protein DPM35_29565 [Mesorhizobium atlanticum]